MTAFSATSAGTGTQVQIKVPSVLGTRADQSGVDDRPLLLEVWAYKRLKSAPSTSGSEQFLTLLDYSLCSPVPFVVLTCNNAPTLLQHIAQNGPVVGGFRDLTAQLLVALGHLHASGVCHLAVCPVNITYGFDGHLLLVNLQHSMPAERSAAGPSGAFLVHCGRNTDAPELWCPELWCDEPSSIPKLKAACGNIVSYKVFATLLHPVACDVWSAGWTLWYAFSGQDLFCPLPSRQPLGRPPYLQDADPPFKWSDTSRQHAILQYCKIHHALSGKASPTQHVHRDIAIVHQRMYDWLPSQVTAPELHVSHSLLLALSNPDPVLRPRLPSSFIAVEGLICLAASRSSTQPSTASASSTPAPRRGGDPDTHS